MDPASPVEPSGVIATAATRAGASVQSRRAPHPVALTVQIVWTFFIAGSQAR